MKRLFKLFLILVCSVFFSCGEETVDFVEFGTITGRVVKKGSFEPIENTKIALSPSNNTAFTDEEGYFTMEEVPAQEYSVSATKEGFLTDFQPVNLESNSTINLVFEMEIETALNKPPSIPELRAPNDGEEDLDTTVELSFKSTDPDEEDIIIYTITLKNDVDNEVIEITNVQDTLYTVSNLRYGLKYFWQVAATDGINDQIFSQTNSFSITELPNNRYFYVKNENGNNVIFSAHYDTDNSEVTNELMITEDTVNSWRPRQNASNDLVAFLRTDNNETHIFTMKSDGSEVTKVTAAVPVTSFNLNEADFSWSSNGDRIIYTNYDKLYLINKDGSGLQEIYQTDNGNYITECDWSFDSSKIALKTNDTSGYNVSIITIDLSGNIIDTILTGESGAAGGLNFSVDGNRLLYVRDLSGFESSNYRQLDSRIFMYDFTTSTSTDVSAEKPAGTNDLDPRFSPDEAEVIFVNTSNDGISQKNIYKVTVTTGTGASVRTELFPDSSMPDWE
jgi:hypothetical protein